MGSDMGLARKYLDEKDLDLYARKIVKWYLIYKLAILGIGIAFISICFFIASTIVNDIITILK